jgi:hypothetical protein
MSLKLNCESLRRNIVYNYAVPVVFDCVNIKIFHLKPIFNFRESLLQVTAEYQYPEELNIFERPPFVVRFQSNTTGTA